MKPKREGFMRIWEHGCEWIWCDEEAKKNE